MAKLTLRGGVVKTAEIHRLENEARAADNRLEQALADVDHWRDRAHAAEQGEADANRNLAALEGDLLSASHEIDRLKAIMLPPPMDGRPIEPTTDPVQALIGEALDMEIGGAEK